MATLEDARRSARAPSSRGDGAQLRLLACGSVDDGKSTLLGRLLFDAGAVLDDQLATLERDSRRWGTGGDARDYALLLDGLSAEREGGITIDVAYRYFSTPRRSFVVIDAPGHEQYTRNMATGASHADLAVILVDARRGLSPQTRRHAFIAATLGIRHAVLAINKMDLVGFSEDRFLELADGFAAAAGALGLRSVVPIPLCARDGDNVAARSARMPWYRGKALLDHLEQVEVAPPEPGPFRLPVQLVRRPDAEFRGYSGTIAAGTVRVGDRVVCLPGGASAAVARIVTPAGDRDHAAAGEAVTLTLSAEIDVSRGDVLAEATAPPAVAAGLRATLLWMASDSMMTGREFRLQLGPASANATVRQINHEVDIESYGRRPATWLPLNGVGSVDLQLDRPLAVAPYAEDRALGALILVDRLSGATVALGVVEQVLDGALPRARPAIATRLRASGHAATAAAIALPAWLLSRDLALAVELGAANMIMWGLVHRSTGRKR